MSRGGHHGRPSQANRGAKDALPALSADQQAALDALNARTDELFSAVQSAAPGGRDTMIAALEPVTGADSAVAQHFAAGLGRARGESGPAAASLASILGESDPRPAVAREARKSRLRLQSAMINPSLALPAVAPAAAVTHTHTHEHEGEPLPLGWRFLEAQASRTREEGDITLIVCFQEDTTQGQVRAYVADMDFWNEGLRDFNRTDLMSRRAYERDIVGQVRERGRQYLTHVTWAQARRLLLTALGVNVWTESDRPDDYERHHDEIAERLSLGGEPTNEALIAEVAAEHDRFARDGDRFLMDPALEPDEIIATFLGAWWLGDFNLAWDLLSNENVIRQKEPREEFVSSRRKWFDEAAPGALRLTVVHEQKRRASGLILPGQGTALASGGRDFEAFWSVALTESPLSGAFDELPMATLTSPETRRHWYWTAYTMQRDPRSSIWVIARLRDEGATSQTIPLDEARKRIKEATQQAEEAAQRASSVRNTEQEGDLVREVSALMASAMHYHDAVIRLLPLDRTVYSDAVRDAGIMQHAERATAIIEHAVQRFPNDTKLLTELAALRFLTYESQNRAGSPSSATQWLDRAIQTMEEVVSRERTAEHLLALGEMRSERGHAKAAEDTLREALALEEKNAAVHASLAQAIMQRARGEDIDVDEEAQHDHEAHEPRDPSEVSETVRAAAHEALPLLRRAAELDPTLPMIFTRIGTLYDLLAMPDDARIAYNDAITRDPADAGAHYALGTLQLQQQKPAAAIPHLERAAELSPFALAVRVSLASAYVAAGRKQEARRELDFADRLSPGLPEVAELRARLARVN